MKTLGISCKPLAALLLLATLAFTGSALAADHETHDGKAAAGKATQGPDKKVVKVDDKKVTKDGKADATKESKDHSAHDAATHDKSK